MLYSISIKRTQKVYIKEIYIQSLERAFVVICIARVIIHKGEQIKPGVCIIQTVNDRLVVVECSSTRYSWPTCARNNGWTVERCMCAHTHNISFPFLALPVPILRA